MAASLIGGIVSQGDIAAKQLWVFDPNAEKAHSLSELSPYYWSSFILVGDAGTIDFANNNFIVIAIFLILITGLFFFFKRKIKN